MKRKIIQIDEQKCNGCGACASACHEGAIQMVEGKARLIRDDYCDGLGDCLPACPTDAISFVVREAAPYNRAAVLAKAEKSGSGCPPHSCPGSMAKALKPLGTKDRTSTKVEAESSLSQWPVQIQLAPISAGFFNHAKLLIAADCSAYAYASFHEDFIRDHITLIGCPKLDAADYEEKLTEIFQRNAIDSITLVRMEVPCCGGLALAAEKALQNSQKSIPYEVVTLSTDGKIL